MIGSRYLLGLAWRLALLILVMTAGSAILLHEVVQRPIDRLRASRVR